MPFFYLISTENLTAIKTATDIAIDNFITVAMVIMNPYKKVLIAQVWLLTFFAFGINPFLMVC
jgi:hypothetical protein